MAVVYTGAVLITGILGDWWPDRVVGPGLGLVLAVIVIAAISILGSIFLSSTANGIAVFMLFGAGLAAGLLGQIGEALSVNTLEDVATVSSWVLPFEALYQAGLHDLTADISGITGVIVEPRAVRRRRGGRRRACGSGPRPTSCWWAPCARARVHAARPLSRSVSGSILD